MMLTPLEFDFAHCIIPLTGKIDVKVARDTNSALRWLGKDSHEDITICIQSESGSISLGLSIYDIR